VAKVDREHVGEWVARYERAWRTAGTDLLAELFTDDATYSMGPYERTREGLAEIAELWEDERQGPDELFTMTREVIAVDADTAIARIEVRYGDPVTHEFRDLWVMRFADDGRCRTFEEWPFWPERTTVPPAP
jgi:ketosteroid isomerase-like protein